MFVTLRWLVFSEVVNMKCCVCLATLRWNFETFLWSHFLYFETASIFSQHVDLRCWVCLGTLRWNFETFFWSRFRNFEMATIFVSLLIWDVVFVWELWDGILTPFPGHNFGTLRRLVVFLNLWISDVVFVWELWDGILRHCLVTGNKIKHKTWQKYVQKYHENHRSWDPKSSILGPKIVEPSEEWREQIWGCSEPPFFYEFLPKWGPHWNPFRVFFWSWFLALFLNPRFSFFWENRSPKLIQKGIPFWDLGPS